MEIVDFCGGALLKAGLCGGTLVKADLGRTVFGITDRGSDDIIFDTGALSGGGLKSNGCIGVGS